MSPEAVDGGLTKLIVKTEFLLLFDYKANLAPKSDLHIIGVNQYKLLFQSANLPCMHMFLAISLHCRYFLCIAVPSALQSLMG